MSLESIRSRNSNGKLDKLLKAAGRTSMGKKTNNNEQDVTYYPERDKAGNGSAIIRFLPGLESEDYPYYVERFQHGFQVNNKWFIEFCPSTLGLECPVCEDNFDIIGEYGKWDDVPEDVQAVIRKRGRNAGFSAGNYCNVLVIKDPMNPENEGKVHLFSFGKGISDMIFGMAQPIDDGLGDVPEPVDVFDLLEGANFKFVIRKKDGRADYSKSAFEKPSPCPEFDVESQIPLLPLIDEKKFKSYDELAERFAKVLNKAKRTPKSAEDMVNEDAPPAKHKSDKSDANHEADKVADSGAADATDGTDTADGTDENMAYFNNIANDIKI